MANERRLIDANALKWKIGQVRLYVASLRCGKTIISKLLESYRNAVFEEIEDAPTVEAVEVVRCKDCKHYEPYLMDGHMCTKFLGVTIPKPNDFCSYGERKDNERKAD